jgi:hypothetical protein
MQYLLLIYNEESRWQDDATPEEREVRLKPWFEYTDWVRDKGWYLGANPLQRTATATTVRPRNGGTITTDGPFAETKEALGGYYLIECENLDQAIEAASRMPAIEYGASVEVRPVMPMPGLEP